MKMESVSCYLGWGLAPRARQGDGGQFVKL